MMVLPTKEWCEEQGSDFEGVGWKEGHSSPCA